MCCQDNVDRALEIGESIMNTFELSWAIGFNAPISREVKTMPLMKNHVGVGAMNVYDTNLILLLYHCIANVGDRGGYRRRPDVPTGAGSKAIFYSSGDISAYGSGRQPQSRRRMM